MLHKLYILTTCQLGGVMEYTQQRHRLMLSNYRMFAGEDVDQARDVLSSMFTEISLEPDRGNSPFKSEVNGVELSKVAITHLRFRNDCVAGPVTPLDFHTLQLTQSGSCTFDIGKQVVPGDQNKGVVLSAGQKVRVHHTDDNDILCLIVKDQVIRDVISSWIGHANFPALRFRPRFDPKQSRPASLIALFNTFVSELNRPNGLLEAPAAAASLEHALITSMLTGLEHNLDDLLRLPAAMAGNTQIRHIEEYLEAHATQPIDMQTIARETGHSVSSIYHTFRRRRGYTPMEFLKRVRMRLARQQLLQAGPGRSVTTIALECGFAHLGRFAAEYKHYFGESPSATIKRTAMSKIPSRTTWTNLP